MKAVRLRSYTPPVAAEPVNAPPPRLLTTKGAAALLGVSVSLLTKARCEGATGRRTAAPPFVRVGGRVFYKRSSLDAWLAALNERDTLAQEAS